MTNTELSNVDVARIQEGARSGIGRPWAAALFLTGLAISAPAVAAPPSSGQAVFEQRCTACHALQPTTPKMGPALQTVVGRKAGSLQGYVYSDAMKKAGFTWTPAKLDAFLAAPNKVVPGTRMMIKLQDAQQRAALVQYLQSLQSKTATPARRP